MKLHPIKTYPEAARSIHLNLAEFCDEDFAYPAMVAVAAQGASALIIELRTSLKEKEAALSEALQRIQAFEKELLGDNGLRAANAAGWALASSRAKSLALANNRADAAEAALKVHLGKTVDIA